VASVADDINDHVLLEGLTPFDRELPQSNTAPSVNCNRPSLYLYSYVYVYVYL
jgi:hypothetical protein